MPDKLVIKNIGPVKNLNIKVTQCILLIGPESSGKSIVAKIISIFQSFEFLAERRSFEVRIKDFGISQFFDKSSFIHYENKAVKFVFSDGKSDLKFKTKYHFSKIFEDYENRKKVFNTIKEAYEKNLNQLIEKKTSLENKLKQTKKRLERQIIKNEILLYSQNITELQVRHIAEMKETVRVQDEVLRYTNYSCYIPAERNLLSIISDAKFSFDKYDVPLSKTLLMFAQKHEVAKHDISEFKIPFLRKYKLEFKNGYEYISINKKSYKLSESSSGLQSLTPLLIVIEGICKKNKVGQGNTFVVEEPELNLFPKTQYELVKYIVRRCLNNPINDTQNDLIITTHSPYILAAINNLILASKLNNKEKKIIKRDYIDTKRMSAYYLNNGRARNIINRTSEMISNNELDNISYDILNEHKEILSQLKSV